MARVKPEAIVEHLDREFRQALADTIRTHLPSATFDELAMFRTFVKRVYHRCSVWETVPDGAVDD